MAIETIEDKHLDVLDEGRIATLLPHGPSAIYLDKVVVYGDHAIGLRDVTLEDCRDHFPEQPILPSHFLLEACFQTAGVMGLWHLEREGFSGYSPVITGECSYEQIGGVLPFELVEIYTSLSGSEQITIANLKLATIRASARVAEYEVMKVRFNFSLVAPGFLRKLPEMMRRARRVKR